MKKLLLLPLISILLTTVGSAAVVLNNSGASAIFQNTNSGSLNGFDVGAGSNLLVAVVQGIDDNSTPSITGVTYNGGSQSFTNFAAGSSANADILNSVWVLANPTAATGTDITFTAADNSSSNYWISVYALGNADTNTANWLVETTTGPTGSTGSTDERLTASLTAVPTGSFVFDAFAASQGNGSGIFGATRTSTLVQAAWNTNSPNNARVSIFGTYIENASGNLDLTGRLDRFSSSEAGAISGVAITVVPEPSAAALLMGALGLLLFIRRRR